MMFEDVGVDLARGLAKRGWRTVHGRLQGAGLGRQEVRSLLLLELLVCMLWCAWAAPVGCLAGLRLLHRRGLIFFSLHNFLVVVFLSVLAVIQIEICY